LAGSKWDEDKAMNSLKMKISLLVEYKNAEDLYVN
jgi:hypothetical protein